MRSTGWAAVPGSGSTGRLSGRGRKRRAAASVAVTALVGAALFGGSRSRERRAAAVAGPGRSRCPGDVDHGSQAGRRNLHDHGLQGLVHPLGGHAGRGLLPARRRGEQPQPRVHRHRRLNVHRPRVARHDPRGEPRRLAGTRVHADQYRQGRPLPDRQDHVHRSRPLERDHRRLGPLARRRHVSRVRPVRPVAGEQRPARFGPVLARRARRRGPRR